MMSSFATNYTGTLTVSINGEGSELPATVSVTENGGKYTLSIMNFMLDEDMPVGNIVLSDLDGTTANGVTTIKTSQTVMFEAGDDPNVGADEWLGLMLNDLGGAPTLMSAKFDSNNLYTSLFIDMSDVLGQMIDVTFATADYPGYYQIPNSGFEEWHNEKYSSSKNGDEPNHWHSFLSHTGSSTLKGLAAAVKTYKESDARPGSKGSYSAKIKPTSVLGVIANGTMTTGRLYAGSMTAADATGNYAFMKLSNTDTDKNGDPFYVELKARPDSIVFWYKFTANNSNYPYASASAILTDGNEVHDPNIGSYATHVVAHASNTTIGATSNWTRLSIPFVYAPTLNIVNNKGSVTGTATGTATEVKGIFVTISTNATPGQGNASDLLYVDDMELIYNPKTESASVSSPKIIVAGKTIELQPNTYEYTISFDAQNAPQRIIRKAGGKTEVKPEDIEVVDGNGDEILSTARVIDTDQGAAATVVVYSDDLKNNKTYTINMNGNVTGIASVVTEAEAVGTTYYNMLGVASKTPFAGVNVVVTEYSDGSRIASKVVK